MQLITSEVMRDLIGKFAATSNASPIKIRQNSSHTSYNNNMKQNAVTTSSSKTLKAKAPSKAIKSSATKVKKSNGRLKTKTVVQRKQDITEFDSNDYPNYLADFDFTRNQYSPVVNSESNNNIKDKSKYVDITTNQNECTNVNKDTSLIPHENIKNDSFKYTINRECRQREEKLSFESHHQRDLQLRETEMSFEIEKLKLELKAEKLKMKKSKKDKRDKKKKKKKKDHKEKHKLMRHNEETERAYFIMMTEEEKRRKADEKKKKKELKKKDTREEMEYLRKIELNKLEHEQEELRAARIKRDRDEEELRYQEKKLRLDQERQALEQEKQDLIERKNWEASRRERSDNYLNKLMFGKH